MSERIVTGKAYRILRETTWDKLSFWKKASDVEYNDGSTMQDNKPIAILQRNHEYRVGEIAYEHSAPSWALLECITQGITAETVPDDYKRLSNISGPGTVITDGTAQFVVYNIVPSVVLSSSPYMIPAMSLIGDIRGNLTASNGEEFYFDVHDGVYGYNTDPNRAIETFRAF